MFGQTRRNTFDDIFNFHREADRIFNQFWSDLPTRQLTPGPGSFQVHTNDDGWRLDVPMPGIDPQHVSLEVAGSTLNIRAEAPGASQDGALRFDQTVTLPQFLDLDRITASHRHGMLQLTLPLKESVRPRRIRIDGVVNDQTQKQLTNA